MIRCILNSAEAPASCRVLMAVSVAMRSDRQPCSQRVRLSRALAPVMASRSGATARVINCVFIRPLGVQLLHGGLTVGWVRVQGTRRCLASPDLSIPLDEQRQQLPADGGRVPGRRVDAPRDPADVRPVLPAAAGVTIAHSVRRRTTVILCLHAIGRVHATVQGVICNTSLPQQGEPDCSPAARSVCQSGGIVLKCGRCRCGQAGTHHRSSVPASNPCWVAHDSTACAARRAWPWYACRA